MGAWQRRWWNDSGGGIAWVLLGEEFGFDFVWGEGGDEDFFQASGLPGDKLDGAFGKGEAGGEEVYQRGVGFAVDGRGLKAYAKPVGFFAEDAATGSTGGDFYCQEGAVGALLKPSRRVHRVEAGR